MRLLISQSAGPLTSLSNKDGRRNWYKPENCPSCWKETGLPFVSVDQSDGKKCIKQIGLMTLVESLQHQKGISPTRPEKINKSMFASRFRYINGTEEECIETGHHDQIEPQETGEGDKVVQETDEEQGGVIVQETGQEKGQKLEGETHVRYEDHSIQVKRERIHSIFTEEITLEEKCLKVRCLITSWDDLWGLAGVIWEYIPVFPDTLSNTWRPNTLIDTNKKYKDLIPLSIGERTAYQSTANGNCIYNAVSIILYGNEDMAVVRWLQC
ncbi:uncharacterized protein LOC127733168 [Mytilus californianus]|uniref:uncharacterized protein LOC127733168 n=1 Tax=Mytilus californianus TaxID=6549 RepID=UPI0022476CFF|nr:uncharacterized protein LOC127733168 [Mytilus californianus]